MMMDQTGDRGGIPVRARLVTDMSAAPEEIVPQEDRLCIATRQKMTAKNAVVPIDQRVYTSVKSLLRSLFAKETFGLLPLNMTILIGGMGRLLHK